jgi:hypothetical protein
LADPHLLLGLKLVLVPASLGLISLAGKKWGPGVAGWIAGFPAVGGPIAFLIALEYGADFAALAAAASLAATLASVSFNLGYARACLKHRWPVAACAGLAAWFSAALLLSFLPPLPWLSLAVALAALFTAPWLFPAAEALPVQRDLTRRELAARMIAGAVLTLITTTAAAYIGTAWSGLLSVFPLLGIVLSVFTHRSSGAVSAATLLRAMTVGLYAFAAFFLALALLLPRFGTAVSFGAALAVAIAVQASSRGYFWLRAQRAL